MSDNAKDSTFLSFPKMPRLSREIIITEKIDGTNAQIFIDEFGYVKAGSRNRWITPEDDNMGFARWVKEHEAELRSLGPGRHYGEWWGQGINRGYGIVGKRFSLFNISKFTDCRDTDGILIPECCSLVPWLWRGEMDTNMINFILERLAHTGSVAAPGFMNPEGIVVYHTAGNTYFKKTIKDDDKPKAEG